MFAEIKTSKGTKIEYWRHPEYKNTEYLDFTDGSERLYLIDEEIKELYEFLKMIMENKENKQND